jgi:hypothetical protein
MQLVDFLLQRLDEDEAVARAATNGAWEAENFPDGFSPMVIADGMAVCETFDKPRLADANHIARHDPARVLADVKAKRAVVEGCAPYDDMQVRRQTRTLAGNVLRALASVYADHPDYDATWAP